MAKKLVVFFAFLLIILGAVSPAWAGSGSITLSAKYVNGNPPYIQIDEHDTFDTGSTDVEFYYEENGKLNWIDTRGCLRPVHRNWMPSDAEKGKKYKIIARVYEGRDYNGKLLAEDSKTVAWEEDDSTQEDAGGIFERSIAAVIDSVTLGIENLAKGWGFKSFEELTLVSGQGVNGDSGSILKPTPFTEDEWTLLDNFYASMCVIAFVLYVLVVIVIAGKFIAAGSMGGAQLRSEAVAALWRWLASIFLIAAAPVFVRLLFVINNSIVDAIAQVGAVVSGSSLTSSSTLAIDNLVTSIHTGSILATSIVHLMLIGIWFYLNLIFIVCRWVIRVIYVFTPIMAVLWVMNKNVTAAAIWAGEMMSNVFVQSAYALSTAVVLVFVQNSGSLMDKILGVYMLVGLGNVLRNSFQGLWTRMAGISEDKIAHGFAVAMGMGSLPGVANLAQTTVNSPSPVGAPSGTSGGMASGKTGETVASPGFSYAASGGSGLASGSINSYTAGHFPPVPKATTSGNPAGFVEAATNGFQNPVAQSLQSGRIARNVVQRVISSAGKPIAATIPGGQALVNSFATVAGAGTQLAVSGASLLKKSYSNAKAESSSFKETAKNLPGAAANLMKAGTGSKDVLKAAAKTGMALGLDALSPRSTPLFSQRLMNTKLDNRTV